MKKTIIALLTFCTFSFSDSIAEDVAETENIIEQLAYIKDPLNDERINDAAENISVITLGFEIAKSDPNFDAELWKHHLAEAITFYGQCITENSKVNCFDELLECIKKLGPNGTIKVKIGKDETNPSLTE